MFDDYFIKLRERLGLDRADYLSQVQHTLDVWYPKKTSVQQVKRGVVRIVTPSASVASELRMRSRELIALHPVLPNGAQIERLMIGIAQID